MLVSPNHGREEQQPSGARLFLINRPETEIEPPHHHLRRLPRGMGFAC
jgi:hypothetical protein